MTTLRALPVFLGCLFALLLQVGCTKKDAPQITSAGTASGQVGTAFTFTVTASNNPTGFTATGLPAGLAINATTGVISGTPTAVASPATVTVTAVNFAGKSGSGTLLITIVAGTVTPGTDIGIDVADGALGNDTTAPLTNHRLSFFDDMTGTNWVKTSAGGVGSADLFSQPVAVGRDAALHIFHLDAALNRVVQMNDSGGVAGFAKSSAFTNGGPQLANPRGMCIGADGLIYIADTGNNRILRMSGVSDTNPVVFPPLGSSALQFNAPTGIFADANHKVYVADTGNHRIVAITDMTRDVSGSGFTPFGVLGSGTNQFNLPSGICVDRNFHIFVADMANNRIVRMDDIDGTNFTPLGGPVAGSGVGEFSNPVGVYTSHSGQTFVADTGNSRIVRFTGITSSGWTTFGSSGTTDRRYLTPTGIFVRESPFAIGRVEHGAVAPLGAMVAGR